MPSRGYLLVTVSDTSTKVDYVKTFLPSEENVTSKNGEVAYSYSIKSSASSVKENVIPKSIELEQNYPNPFKQQTTIRYQLPTKNYVNLKVYDILGREVVTLVNQEQLAGNYTVAVNFDKLSLIGSIYYYKITIGNYTKSMKMICFGNRN